MLHCGRRWTFFLEGGLTAPESRVDGKLPIHWGHPAPTNAYAICAPDHFYLASDGIRVAIKIIEPVGSPIEVPAFLMRIIHSGLTTRYRYLRSAFV